MSETFTVEIVAKSVIGHGSADENLLGALGELRGQEFSEDTQVAVSSRVDEVRFGLTRELKAKLGASDSDMEVLLNDLGVAEQRRVLDVVNKIRFLATVGRTLLHW